MTQMEKDLEIFLMENLPQDVCSHILSFVGLRDLSTCSTLNKRFYRFANTNLLWKQLVKRDWDHVDLTDFANGYAHGTDATTKIHQLEVSSWKQVYKNILEGLSVLDSKGVDTSAISIYNNGLSVKRIASGPWKSVFTRRSFNKGTHIFEIEVISAIKGDGFIYAGVKTSSTASIRERQWTYGNNGSVVRTNDNVVWTKDSYGNGDIVGFKCCMEEMVTSMYLNGKLVLKTKMNLHACGVSNPEEDKQILYYFVCGFANYNSEFLVHQVPKYKYHSIL